MIYPQSGELYRNAQRPSEIILIIRLSESKNLVKTQHITEPSNSGWRGVDDISHNWELLTKENK